MIDRMDLDGISVIDYFAAGGGWDEAMRMLGRTDVLGIENNKAACATAEAAGHRRLLADVRDMRPHLCEGMVEGFIASPPCQSFSMAGKGAGRDAMAALYAALTEVAYGATPEDALAMFGHEKLDERSALVLEPMVFIRDVRPEWVAMEQVPAVLPIWQLYASLMASLWGYEVETDNLYAEQYGVPQTRKRALLVASLHGHVALPTPTHSRYHNRTPARLDEGVEKWVSMAEALGWGMTHRPSMTVTAGGTDTGGSEPFGNGSRKGMAREREAGRWVERGPVAAVEGDTSWVYDRPSPTIVGSFAPDVVAKPGYRKAGDPPRQKTPGSVRITLEEAAVLQSFRPDYPWQGSKTGQFRQVGDAIPPLLAVAVLRGMVQRAQLAA